MKNLFKFIALLVAPLALAACDKPEQPDPVPPPGDADPCDYQDQTQC